LLLSIPCFYLSITSIFRIRKVYKHIKRARDPDLDIDPATVHPRRPRLVYLARAISTPPPSSPPPVARRELLNPALTSPNLKAQQFHKPFSPPPLNLEQLNLNSSTSTNVGTDVRESPVSSNFPTFANPPEGGTIPIDPDGRSSQTTPHPAEGLREILAAVDNPVSSAKRSSYQWPEEGSASEFEYGKMDDDDDDDIHTPQRIPRSMGSRRSRRPIPPSLAPPIWRIIFFQFAFTIVQALGAISTLIAVTKDRPPSAFGTQHVSLLIAAWGPFFIFGHLAAVRKVFVSWLPWKHKI